MILDVVEGNIESHVQLHQSTIIEVAEEGVGFRKRLNGVWRRPGLLGVG